MTDKSSLYFNQFLPHGGSIGLKQVHTFNIGPTATSIDLRTVFGNIGNGDFWTVKATSPNAVVPSAASWKTLFCISQNPGTVSENAPGQASGLQGWPLLDGQEFKGHLSGGREVATGFATGISPFVLNVKTTLGSGVLSVMRSTLDHQKDLGQFQPPVPLAMFPPGPSGGWGPRP